MAKGRKRRSDSRYDIFNPGDKIPLPDYAMFESVCADAAAELGISKDEVLKVYKKFIDRSLELMFPEGSPRDLPDEALLSSRRMLKIPGIATAELTVKSLERWRKIEDLIRAKREQS